MPNTDPELPDLVIEYSTDGRATWHHGKTVPRWVGADKTALSGQLSAVRQQARAEHGPGAVATRVLAEDDPRAVLNQPPASPPVPGPGGQYADDATVTVSRLQLVQVLGDEGLIVTGTGRGDQVFRALVARAERDGGRAPVPVGLDHWQEPRYGR